MKSNELGGKIFFFKTDKTQNPKDCFSPILEVNSNFDNLKSLTLTNGKAYGITTNNELLEWEFEKKKIHKNIPVSLPQENSENNSSNTISTKIQNKKNDFYFLLTKPSYRFHKLKISSISLNKSMCLSLDTNGNVYVWGQSKDGLLGLGYEVTSVENPTILDGLVDIVDISLSDYHAVALNSSGIPFSWGLGKYGELGLERSIYSPVPHQMNSEGLYSRVFCGNLITCFLDLDGHFSYFGVIIKQLSGNNSTVTTKNLLNDQNIDSKSIFLEKEFEELEDQKFKEIVIGNGFIGLLGNTGTLFTLEYNDKLTMLYSKYYLYNIVVVKNCIYGLAKDNVKIVENKNNLKENNLMNSTNEEKIKSNYYLCRWSSKSSSENEVCSDIWTTTLWKFKDDFTNVIENCKLLDTNDKRNIILLLDSDEKYKNNLNTSVFNPNKKLLDLSSNNDLSQLDMSVNNNTTFTENIMNFNLNKKKLPEKFLDYEDEFDDSYNLKYKRTKAKRKSILKDLPYIGTIRSKSLSKYLNKSYNASFQNSAINLNKSNFVNFGNNNISAIGPNTSGFFNKKTALIPTSNNYKKTNGKIFTNNFRNYNNLSNQNNSSKNKNNNFTQNSKSFSINNNDISKDNHEIENNFSPNDYNNNSNYKSNQKDDNDKVNIYEESIDAKEKELNKYRSEIDNIIANYKNKQNIKKNNLMNKYGLSRENNINIINQNRRENDNYINNQNISRENIINIKDEIENSKSQNNDNNINLEDESPYKYDLNKRYEAENELNANIMGISIKENENIHNEKNPTNKKEIMNDIQNYFQINKTNSKKETKMKNKSKNEIEFDMDRQETFQNINNPDNNRRENNSFIINNPLNLNISNSELSELVPIRCLSEGNDILNNNLSDENEQFNNNINNKNTKEKIQFNNNENQTDKVDNNENYNDQLISSPAFNNKNIERNRLSNLIKNEQTKNKNAKNIKGENKGINLQINNKNKDLKINQNKDINIDKNSRFSFGINQNIKINSSNLKQGKNKNIFIKQNINNIKINAEKKLKDINKEINLDSGKKDDKGKNEINNKQKENIKNLNNGKNNQEKLLSKNSKNKKDGDNNQMKPKINSKTNKNNNKEKQNKNKNSPKNLENDAKITNNNYQKQNIESNNFDDLNKNNIQNKYGDREPDLNNCDFDENNIKVNEFEKEENNNNKNKIENNKIKYQKENIYSYKYGNSNEKKNNNNNNLSIDNIGNNINYKNDNKLSKNQINKYNVNFFCHLLKNYMRKKAYLMCAYEIANFQKKYEKNLSLRLLFMIIKKRIIFYKIKFFHRYKKIYKYMVKYKKNNNILSEESAQKKKQYNNSGNKK